MALYVPLCNSAAPCCVALCRRASCCVPQRSTPELCCVVAAGGAKNLPVQSQSCLHRPESRAQEGRRGPVGVRERLLVREDEDEQERRATFLCVPVELKLFNALALWIWMKQRLLLPVQTGTGPFFFEDAPFTPNHSESWTCKPVQCSEQVIFERFATFPDFCPNLFEMCSLHQIQNENICTKIN